MKKLPLTKDPKIIEIINAAGVSPKVKRALLRMLGVREELIQLLVSVNATEDY